MQFLTKKFPVIKKIFLILAEIIINLHKYFVIRLKFKIKKKKKISDVIVQNPYFDPEIPSFDFK